MRRLQNVCLFCLQLHRISKIRMGNEMSSPKKKGKKVIVDFRILIMYVRNIINDQFEWKVCKDVVLLDLSVLQKCSIHLFNVLKF